AVARRRKTAMNYSYAKSRKPITEAAWRVVGRGKWQSTTRVMRGMQRLQAGLGHMGIDLRGGQVAMPKQQLHHTQVSAMVEQVGGKGMTQGMRRQRFENTGMACMQLDAVPKGLAG